MSMYERVEHAKPCENIIVDFLRTFVKAYHSRNRDFFRNGLLCHILVVVVNILKALQNLYFYFFFLDYILS